MVETMADRTVECRMVLLAVETMQSFAGRNLALRSHVVALAVVVVVAEIRWHSCSSLVPAL